MHAPYHLKTRNRPLNNLVQVRGGGRITHDIWRQVVCERDVEKAGVDDFASAGLHSSQSNLSEFMQVFLQNLNCLAKLHEQDFNFSTRLRTPLHNYRQRNVDMLMRVAIWAHLEAHAIDQFDLCHIHNITGHPSQIITMQLTPHSTIHTLYLSYHPQHILPLKPFNLSIDPTKTKRNKRTTIT